MEPDSFQHGQNAQQVLKLFRCPRCGQLQDFICPGFGQHTPSKTLVRIGDNVQCIQCGQFITTTTCSCGCVTTLTPDILDDPTANNYVTGKQLAEYMSRYLEIITKQFIPAAVSQINQGVDETLITELHAILADWESLFASLPEKYPPVNPAIVRIRIADTKSQIAGWYYTRHNSQEALRYYERAQQDYEALGDKQRVQECWNSIAQVHLREEGIIDKELQRRQAELETLSKGSLHYVESVIELSNLYAQAGDDFETEKVLLAAEEAFKSLKLVDDNGRYLPDLLEQRIFEQDKITSDQETYQKYALLVHTLLLLLQEKLYTALTAVYRLRDVEKVLHYSRLAKQTAGNEGHMASSVELQLALTILRRDVNSLSMQSSEQDRNSLADNLLQGARALETKSRSPNVLDGVITALLLQADILLVVRRDDEAIAVLSNVQNELKDGSLHDRGLQVLAKLAEAHAHKRQWREVSAICDEGIALVEHYRYKVTGQYMQSAYLASRIGLYSWGVRAAYELKNYPLMLQRAELSKCRSVLRYQQHLSALTADEQIQLTEQKFQQVSEQIATANSDNEMLGELQNKRRTLWDLLTVQRFQSRTGESLPEFSVEAVQATLAVDEAIVYYYWLDKYTLLITIIDQKHVIPVLRFLTTEEQNQLKDFANFVLELSRESAKSHLDTVQAFSSLLLPEEAAILLQEKQRLLFSPHRLLHAIPFHALQWNADFLIEHFAVMYVPNLSILLFRYSPSKQHRVLALGVCDYQVPGYTLAPLEQAEQEVENLEQLCMMRSLSITALKGPEARNERLRHLETTGELEQFTCLHFATHGKNIDSDTPMESYLFLRDSQLDGLEIANWQLQADVVVLSACCSGQRPISGRWMEELPGDELFGLQSAFFTAGAKRILSCLWPVDDTVASQITKTFHDLLMNGQLPEVAIQMATKEYLKTAKVRTRKIYYWAPFFLSAMGRPTFENY